MQPAKQKIFGILGAAIIVSVLLISGIALGDPPDFSNSVSVGNDGDDDTDPDLKGISWIAFCSFDGVTSENITNLEATELNIDGEPIAVTWSSTTEVDYVIIKYGTTVQVFVDGMSGTVKVGEGSQTYEGVTGAVHQFSGQKYCTGHDADLSGVKFEWGNSPSPFFWNDDKDFWNNGV